MSPHPHDTIVALSTHPGVAAIALVRLSGRQAISIAASSFAPRSSKINLATVVSHRTCFGEFKVNGQVLDEVLLTVFRAPASYTGEDTVEISCHGSVYIQQKIIETLMAAGARQAEPGEFTMRAFLNGRMDLSQAEAVADLINSPAAFAHELALKQMRGTVSKTIAQLRRQLLQFASLIELELDFSEEDVEFADRRQLKDLLTSIDNTISGLLENFRQGNVIRSGVPVVIAGRPNAGKSTLLNALVEHEKAIVTEIAGTTRDLIEDRMVYKGILFRFIDTAGIRHTEDLVEKIGVSRSFEAMASAAIVIMLFDPLAISVVEAKQDLLELRSRTTARIVVVANKADLPNARLDPAEESELGVISISAKNSDNVIGLKDHLVRLLNLEGLHGQEAVITNARHAASLSRAGEALQKVSEGLDAGVPGDLLALDLRYALQELGAITGEVSSEDLLKNIFSSFCIGK